MRIEEVILSALINQGEYTRKVIPHIKGDYFTERIDRYVFETINEYFQEYNELPTREIIESELLQRHNISQDDLDNSLKLVKGLSIEEKNEEWLVNQTETFCRDKAIYNAILESINIIDGANQKLDKGSIPTLLQDALSVTFDTKVGHDYFSDAAERYDAYNNEEARIPFDIQILNEITDGGLPNKTLAIILAESGGGKSLVMAHMASANIRQGKNVLYISMEMSEHKTSERIDANLLGVNIRHLKTLGKEVFTNKINNLRSKSYGRLYVKEYPTGAAHAGHFRALFEDLKVKQEFIPDIVYVDYLGICASQRVRMGGAVNSYAVLKSVAEELRSLAIEYDIPMVTAGQVNRTAYNNSDFGMDSISESMGIVHTADLMIGLVRTPELDASGQLMISQMKNRYNDVSNPRSFVVGIDRSQMKLIDLGKFHSEGVSKSIDVTNDNELWKGKKSTIGSGFTF